MIPAHRDGFDDSLFIEAEIAVLIRFGDHLHAQGARLPNPAGSRACLWFDSQVPLAAGAEVHARRNGKELHIAIRCELAVEMGLPQAAFTGRVVARDRNAVRGQILARVLMSNIDCFGAEESKGGRGLYQRG